MYRRGVIVLGSIALLLAGCGDHYFGDNSEHLFSDEIEFLSEDVIELLTIVFQIGENAFVGDAVRPVDIVDPAGPGNDFFVTYDLPVQPRIGLGAGFGRVALQVAEDGILRDDPLSFSFATTSADIVDLVYDLSYDGVTASGRPTEVDFTVFLNAVRTGPGEPFDVEYFIEGGGYLDVTFCELSTLFRAPGPPRTGIEPNFGDGAGLIDDPDVFDVFELDLDFIDPDIFRVEGDVGHCCFFEEIFLFNEVL